MTSLRFASAYPLNLPLKFSPLRIPATALLFAFVSFITRFKYIRSNLQDGLVYFADPDCYTRLYRVKLILSGGPLIQSWHSFENYPDGIPVHTTALLDWLIALLSLCFKALPVTAAHALDWAGFIVGPLAAAAAGAAIYYITLDFKPVWARTSILFTYLLSPMLIWSTASARPDHQCLIVSFLLIAWALELKRWRDPSLHLWTGIVWGLALWTSLLEPLLFLVVVLAVNLLMRRKEDRRFWLPLLLVGTLTAVMEGLRWRAYFGISDPRVNNWMGTIGELQNGGFKWLPQYGLAVYLLPLLLFVFRKQKCWQYPETSILLISTAISFVLAVFQLRWGYFFAVTSMYSLFLILPGDFKSSGWNFLRVLHFIPIVIWNMAEVRMIAPPDNLVEIRKVAGQIRTTDQSIMAPWWFSPALLYYSGAPIIASSSHESIEGIVDSAKYFTSRSFPEAESLLKKHQAGWVLVCYPEWLYRNSMQVLTGKKFREIASPDKDRLRIVSVRLFEYVAVPTQYKIAFASPNLRLYRYEPETP